MKGRIVKQSPVAPTLQASAQDPQIRISGERRNVMKPTAMIKNKITKTLLLVGKFLKKDLK